MRHRAARHSGWQNGRAPRDRSARAQKSQPFERTLTGLLIVAGTLTVLAVVGTTLALGGALRGIGL